MISRPGAFRRFHSRAEVPLGILLLLVLACPEVALAEEAEVDPLIARAAWLRGRLPPSHPLIRGLPEPDQSGVPVTLKFRSTPEFHDLIALTAARVRLGAGVGLIHDARMPTAGPMGPLPHIVERLATGEYVGAREGSSARSGRSSGGGDVVGRPGVCQCWSGGWIRDSDREPGYGRRPPPPGPTSSSGGRAARPPMSPPALACFAS